MGKNDEKLLTETELELMNIIWNLGEATVREVMDQLSHQRDLAYTSVSTILRILEKKLVLTSRKMGKGHVYIPILTREEYKKGLQHLVSNVFAGTPSLLVKTLLSTENLNQDELKEIKKMIAKRMGV